MTNEVSEIDLAECDAEPIHLIGSIRPSGCLLAIHRQNLTIQYVSDNVQTLFLQNPSEMIGKPIRAFISSEVANSLLSAIRGVQSGERLTERFRWNPDGHEKVSLVHLAACEEIVVIEILLQDDPVSEVTDRLHRTVALEALGEIADVGVLMDQVAINIRKFTEFDRVMVYRFADDGSGYVAAESCRSDLESFLGLHYPASDIPAQARRLFIKNRVRVVEDVGYTPVPLHGFRADPEELDLSGSLLRSVSPIHLRYLSNMGVGSSLAISLVRDGELWGMIACHHYSPKSLPPCMLGFTEMLSQVLSVMADRVERTNRNEYGARCIDRMDKAMQQITANPDGLVAGIQSSLRRIANSINADGIVLVRPESNGEFGDVPTAEQTQSLVQWLEAEGQPFLITHHLGEVWPQARELEGFPAGMLAFRWTEDSWLIFFRNEIIQSVFWAGDPSKTVLRETDGRLSPRGSFEAWKEDVRGRSRKWLNAEVDAVRPLRRLSAVQEIADAQGMLTSGISAHAGSNDPVLIVDLEGTVVDWNYAVEKRFGVSEMEGKRLLNMLPFVTTSSLTQLLEDAAKGEVWVGEYEQAPHQSAYEVVVFPVSSNDLHANRVGVAMRDVSERKILEEHLRNAQKMEAFGQLTSGMVHNFNNLLTVILSSTEVALSHLDAAHPSYKEVRAAQTAGVSAARIVRDLMAFATDDSPQATEVNVGKLVNDLRDVLRHVTRPNIEIEFEVSTSDACTFANRSQIEQVLINLIANARDAIDGDGKISVKVLCEYVDDDRADGLSLAAANYVVLSVKDSGGGIDNEVIDRIFDPFFTTKAGGKGSGLGLSSTDSIIKSFGGAIRVLSEAGRGTQFIIYLPQSESQASGQPQSLAGKTILIVDDQTSVAASLAALLKVTECEVKTAKSGSEALTKIDLLAPTFDLLITDQSMPDMSGLDLIRNVRKYLPFLPIILMSGGPVEYDHLELSDVTFINKPFDPTKFVKAVTGLIQS